MKKIPDKIYLQVHSADRSDMTAEEMKEYAPEVTWCEDKIFDTDVEYVRVKGKG
jgi:hypothetical protein